MTTLCGGGSSAPKASTPAVVKITLSLLLARLGAYGSLASWISNILGYLGLPDIDTATFCATDPPAIPTFDFNDALAIASLPIGSPQMAVTAGKVSDLMQHLLWYELCECTSGSLTALPAPASPPTGTGQPLPVSAGGACLTMHDGPVARAGANLMSWGGTGLHFPPTCKSMRATITQVQGANPAHPNFHDNLYLYDIYGAPLSAVGPVTIPAISGTTQVWDFTRPDRAEGFLLEHSFGSTASTDTIEITWQFFCGTVTPSGATGCCPPDDITLGLLQQIISLVTLTQRQAVPFAYVPGATHTGLSGNGHINVQGLIGAKITASVPGRAGIDFGDPDTVYQIGHINWGNADGYGPREQLVTSPQLSFPNLAGNYTRIGYTIPADVAIDILELVREP